MVRNRSKICSLAFLSNTINYWNKKLFGEKREGGKGEGGEGKFNLYPMF